MLARFFTDVAAAQRSHTEVFATVTPAVPSIARQFTVDMDVEMDMDGSFPAEIVGGSLVYDADVRAFRMSMTEFVPALGDHAYINQTQLAIGDDKYFNLMNGQCLDMASQLQGSPAFDSYFGWLSGASYNGSAMVTGRSCDVYSLDVPVPGTNDSYSFRICLNGDQPLQMNQSLPGQFMSYTYRNFRPTADEADLRLPAQCEAPPAACGDGHIAKQMLYIFHPADNFDIAGQDVADAMGDATFLCSDKMMWVRGGYSLFSVFEVSWMEKFGQYANCPPDPTSPTGARCMGGDDFHVGRASAMSLGHMQGQCDGDAPEWFQEVGIWYSMPVAGQCKEGQELGEGSCSWRVERRVKTIDMACLFDDAHVIDQLCQNTTAPYTEVTLALLKALESENPASGGCAPVEPPASCAANPGCAGLVGNCCPADDGSQLACCASTSSTVVV